MWLSSDGLRIWLGEDNEVLDERERADTFLILRELYLNTFLQLGAECSHVDSWRWYGKRTAYLAVVHVWPAEMLEGE